MLADSKGTSERTELLDSLTLCPRSSSFFTVMPPSPFSLPTGSDRLGMSALLAVRVRCVATCQHHTARHSWQASPATYLLYPVW